MVATARITQYWQARVVQSYSPGGANIYPLLLHGSLNSRESALKRHLEKILDRFSRFCRANGRNRETTLRQDICSNIAHLAVVLAMRPIPNSNNDNVYGAAVVMTSAMLGVRPVHLMTAASAADGYQP